MDTFMFISVHITYKSYYQTESGLDCIMIIINYSHTSWRQICMLAVSDIHLNLPCLLSSSCVSIVKQKSAFAPVLKLQSSPAQASSLPICTVRTSTSKLSLFIAKKYICTSAICIYTTLGSMTVYAHMKICRVCTFDTLMSILCLYFTALHGLVTPVTLLHGQMTNSIQKYSSWTGNENICVFVFCAQAIKYNYTYEC